MRAQLAPLRPFLKAGQIATRILIRLIPGRKKALELEDDAITAYRRKYGTEPVGNEGHTYPSHGWRGKK